MKLSIVKKLMGKTKEETKPFVIIGSLSDGLLLLNEVDIPGLIFCKHESSRPIGTPITDVFYEECKCCGMSRLCNSVSAGDWELVDVEKMRGEFQDREGL